MHPSLISVALNWKALPKCSLPFDCHPWSRVPRGPLQSAASGSYSSFLSRACPQGRLQLAESSCRVCAEPATKRQKAAAVRKTNDGGVHNSFQGDFSKYFSLMCLDEDRVGWVLTFIRHLPATWPPQLDFAFAEPNPNCPVGNPSSQTARHPPEGVPGASL